MSNHNAQEQGIDLSPVHRSHRLTRGRPSATTSASLTSASERVPGNMPVNTLVPRGFERVAHPVFFGSHLSTVGRSVEWGDVRNDSDRVQQQRQAEAPNNDPSTTGSFVRASYEQSGGVRVKKREEGGGATEKIAKPGHDASTARNARVGGKKAVERDVDSICPVCLLRLKEPVTLTSCLHTFCQECILEWYQRTVAVALASGGQAVFWPQTPSQGSSGSARDKIPAPYRCPLCNVPGPYFLRVEAVGVDAPEEKLNTKPMLKFKLLGARTILNVPGAGNNVLREARDFPAGAKCGGGTVYPSMDKLRSAVRMQLAVAGAVSAADAEKAKKDETHAVKDLTAERRCSAGEEGCSVEPSGNTGSDRHGDGNRLLELPTSSPNIRADGGRVRGREGRDRLNNVACERGRRRHVSSLSSSGGDRRRIGSHELLSDENGSRDFSGEEKRQSRSRSREKQPNSERHQGSERHQSSEKRRSRNKRQSGETRQGSEKRRSRDKCRSSEKRPSSERHQSREEQRRQKRRRSERDLVDSFDQGEDQREDSRGGDESDAQSHTAELSHDERRRQGKRSRREHRPQKD